MVDQVDNLAEPVVSTTLEVVKEVNKNSEIDVPFTVAFYALVCGASAVLGAVGWSRFKKWNEARKVVKEAVQAEPTEEVKKK